MGREKHKIEGRGGSNIGPTIFVSAHLGSVSRKKEEIKSVEMTPYTREGGNIKKTLERHLCLEGDLYYTHRRRLGSGI